MLKKGWGDDVVLLEKAELTSGATWHAAGFKQVGNLRLAMSQNRMDEYYQYAATASTIGIGVQFLSPAEIHALWPLCTIDGIVENAAAPVGCPCTSYKGETTSRLVSLRIMTWRLLPIG